MENITPLLTSSLTLIATAMPEGRVFGLDKQTLYSIIFQLVNLIILSAILTKVLYNPVKNFMARRREKISTQMVEARDKMTEAINLKANYEKRLSEIENERLDILSQAQKDGEREKDMIIQNALQEAKEIRQNAREKVQEDRDLFEKEAKSYIITLSADMASKFLSTEVSEEEHSLINQKIVADMEDKVE